MDHFSIIRQIAETRAAAEAGEIELPPVKPPKPKLPPESPPEPPPELPPEPPSEPFQFSLRTLLLLPVVVALACWFAIWIAPVIPSILGRMGWDLLPGLALFLYLLILFWVLVSSD